MPLHTSTVVFWDDSHFHTVARGIEFANGIALGRARGWLYVAVTRWQKIYVYAWDAGNPAKELSEVHTIDLSGCPDNPEWDEKGNVWIAGDADFMQLALYAVGKHPTAPSMVLRVFF